MPPKKQEKPKAPKAPAVDKSFGVKNKKGKVGQQTVALAKQQAAQKGQNEDAKRKEKEKADRDAKKALEARKKEELSQLFVQVDQKAPFGVDPKTILCINFKNGNCTRGNRCKFSHDPEVGRKTAKKDIYTDTRDTEEKKDEETMENWTEEKLREVIAKKMGTEVIDEGPSGKGKNTQDRYDIVCKHFIDAIESSKYGWFWVCPNGGTECKYRHALPPGFVLKSQRKKDEEAEKEREISMEEFLEVERHKLPKEPRTPVNAETFKKWKETRMDKKSAEQDAHRKTKELQAQAGKSAGMSGRDLFTFNPLLLDENENEDEEEDDDDWDIEEYRKRTMAERDEQERKRMEAVGGAIGNMDLNGVAS